MKKGAFVGEDQGLRGLADGGEETGGRVCELSRGAEGSLKFFYQNVTPEGLTAGEKRLGQDKVWRWEKPTLSW